jgi:hypothetical protein
MPTQPPKCETGSQKPEIEIRRKQANEERR